MIESNIELRKELKPLGIFDERSKNEGEEKIRFKESQKSSAVEQE